MKFNKLSPIHDTTRAWLLGVEPQLFGHYLAILGLSTVFFLIGWILYRDALPHDITRFGM